MAVLSTCVRCQTSIGWVDCPTGGWWAHSIHPDDNHDAEPPEVVTMTVRADEAAELGTDRCSDPRCGHLLAVHNTHCCQFCNVGGCQCERG